jgi:hypothetical protein
MLQPRQSPFHRLRDEPRHHSPALDPELAALQELQVARSVTDDESAKSFVADEDIGAQTQHEILDTELSGSRDSPCQILGRCCIVEEIGGTANPKCGVLSKRLIALEPLCVQSTF